jgi:hypothetical protein
MVPICRPTSADVHIVACVLPLARADLQAQAYVKQYVGELLQPIAAAINAANDAANDTAAKLQLAARLQANASAGTAVAAALAKAHSICRLAGQQGLTQQAAAILSIPCIPTELAQLVRDAGLQFTTAQLVAAARSRVEGLETWVLESCWPQPGAAVVKVLSIDLGSQASACRIESSRAPHASGDARNAGCNAHIAACQIIRLMQQSSCSQA